MIALVHADGVGAGDLHVQGYLLFLRQEKLPVIVLSESALADFAPRWPRIVIVTSVPCLPSTRSAVDRLLHAGSSVVVNVDPGNEAADREQLRSFLGMEHLAWLPGPCDLVTSLHHGYYDEDGKILCRTSAWATQEGSSSLVFKVIDQAGREYGGGWCREVGRGRLYFLGIPWGRAYVNSASHLGYYFPAFAGNLRRHHRVAMACYTSETRSGGWKQKLRAPLDRLTSGLLSLLKTPDGYPEGRLTNHHDLRSAKVSQQELQAFLRALLLDACGSVVPYARLDYWPSGKTFAFSQRIDVDSDLIFDHQDSLRRQAREHAVPLSLYFNLHRLEQSSKFQRFEALLNGLREDGHLIGVHVARHPGIHHGEWMTSYRVAPREEIDRLAADCADILKRAKEPNPRLSFASPCENLDPRHIPWFVANGFTTLSAGNFRRDGLPEVLEGKCVHVPNGVVDMWDIKYFRSGYWRALVEHKATTGHLLCTYFHPEYYRDYEREIVDVWAQVNRHRNVWKATVEQIGDWWRTRDACSVSVQDGPDGYELNVRAAEKSGVELRVENGDCFEVKQSKRDGDRVYSFRVRRQEQ